MILLQTLEVFRKRLLLNGYSKKCTVLLGSSSADGLPGGEFFAGFWQQFARFYRACDRHMTSRWRRIFWIWRLETVRAPLHLTDNRLAGGTSGPIWHFTVTRLAIREFLPGPGNSSQAFTWNLAVIKLVVRRVYLSGPGNSWQPFIWHLIVTRLAGGDYLPGPGNSSPSFNCYLTVTRLAGGEYLPGPGNSSQTFYLGWPTPASQAENICWDLAIFCNLLPGIWPSTGWQAKNICWDLATVRKLLPGIWPSPGWQGGEFLPGPGNSSQAFTWHLADARLAGGEYLPGPGNNLPLFTWHLTVTRLAGGQSAPLQLEVHMWTHLLFE